jgi:signal transduction histidine kinase
MRPLDRLPSLKAKLSVVIVAAVAVTVVVVAGGHDLRLNLAPLALIALLLSLGMIQLLARGMTSPLREMADAARAMAKGDYGRRVTATSRDEVGELARSFNKMASELAEVDTMRRDFLANVSHELRTPIGALQAVLENLVDGVESADPRVLDTMLAQVKRLGRLVEQLLDLSRLESGAIPFNRCDFPVKPLLEQAVRESELNSRRDQKNVEVTCSIEPEGLLVNGDPERVHQVVFNIVDNAVRHSPQGGRVDVNARTDSEVVTIEVVDQGPGIPPSEEARVFERFYRVDAARASSDGGTGLGLAIAKWIVDMHGGGITVEQGRPFGCRMVVTLPAAAA